MVLIVLLLRTETNVRMNLQSSENFSHQVAQAAGRETCGRGGGFDSCRSGTAAYLHRASCSHQSCLCYQAV